MDGLRAMIGVKERIREVIGAPEGVDEVISESANGRMKRNDGEESGLIGVRRPRKRWIESERNCGMCDCGASRGDRVWGRGEGACLGRFARG